MGALRNAVLLIFVVLVAGELLTAMVAGESFLQVDDVSILIKPSSSTLLLPLRIHGYAGSEVLLQSYSSQEAVTISAVANTSGAIGGVHHCIASTTWVLHPRGPVRIPAVREMTEHALEFDWSSFGALKCRVLSHSDMLIRAAVEGFPEAAIHRSGLGTLRCRVQAISTSTNRAAAGGFQRSDSHPDPKSRLARSRSIRSELSLTHRSSRGARRLDMAVT